MHYLTDEFVTTGNVPEPFKAIQVLQTALNYYIETQEKAVPLYKRLFEELDKRRLEGDNEIEVYLGRDAIGAFEGRRALKLARERKLGLTERKAIKMQGESVGIAPKYLVFPGLFRDRLDSYSIQAYLEQEGITPDEKLKIVFIDTSYTGSIPKRIMDVLGIGYYAEGGYSSRILLLSAHDKSQGVNFHGMGMDEKEIDSIVARIEHNPKTEESAIGLAYDKNGKIKLVAPPTSSEDQLYARLIQLAVRRHFWIQGYTGVYLVV